MSGSDRSSAFPALHLPEPRFLPAAGAVLLLHGGRADSLAPPSALNLPDLRMKAFARVLGQDPRHADVLIGYVRYRMRGWNGERADPVHDTRRALAELADLVGPLPVVLLGHSMGARAALRAADDPHVRGVVALAPWCPPGEPATHLAHRTVIALHDPADRITSATDTWAHLHRAEVAGARVRGIRMPAGRHAMISRSGLWHSLAARSTAETLGLDSPPCTSTPETMWGAGPLDAAMFIPSAGERHPIRLRRSH
ncbi:alpha/beta fold hydrolase [Streptomyces hydrogenans]|uniref:alpha/beta fold hydrolase n=1 Tax=Streptomyces hydrogenans TaxID=1873719 RepID=UPI0035E3B11D